MKIEKSLTANDIGITGAHQAGICIPKAGGLISFFPNLDVNIKNPRTVLQFADDSGDKWKFNFIYYNNKFFGGTRNEYRLTGMTVYIRKKNLKIYDKIILSKKNDDYLIKYEKQNKSTMIFE